MTSYAFNDTIPDGPNNPSDDQPIMLANNVSAKAIMNVDHIGYGLANGGIHRQVNMFNSAPPRIGDIVLYSRNAITNLPVLWQKNSAIDAPLNIGIYNGSDQGYSSIYGGLVLQWGSVASPGGSGMVNFPYTFTVKVFTIQLTARNDGSHSAFTYYIDGAPLVGSFNYRGSTTGSDTLFWFAVGV